MNQYLFSAGLQDGMSCVSSAVSLGDFVYISAQTGQGKELEEQVINTIQKITDVISEFGIEFRHVVKLTVYLSDISKRDEFLQIFSHYVEAPYPACSIVEVGRLENDAMIAMEGFAINTTRYEKAQRESSCCEDCSDCSGCN